VLVDLPPIKPEVLTTRVISRVDAALAAQLKLSPEHTSIGIITATIDDALYVALDEGTKAAPVEVVYARSFYAGSAHASGPLSGEVIGIYAGSDPDRIQVALAACLRTLAEEAWFYAADAAGRLGFFPHVVAATGSYLSREAGVPLGAPIAYLIAPPAESIIGLDAALKAAPVELKKWFGPPSETNYGGGYLAGDLSSCEAAARAFAAAVVDVARHPRDAARDARAAGDALGARPPGPSSPGSGRFRVLATGERLPAKPEHLTHLIDDESLVPKTHPRIVLRGKLDTLQGALLEAQVEADRAGAAALVGELGDLLALTRQVVGAEVTGRALAEWRMLGLTPADIRYVSHHTKEYFGVPFMYPSVRQGPVVARLYSARASAREAELAALAAFSGEGGEPSRGDIVVLLNRLSNALYIMTCKFVSGRYDGDHRPIGPVKGWKPPASERG